MQEHKQKATAKQTETEAEQAEPVNLADEELSEDVNDLLDEIDSVLEKDALTFVNSYVQKGGQ